MEILSNVKTPRHLSQIKWLLESKFDARRDRRVCIFIFCNWGYHRSESLRMAATSAIEAMGGQVEGGPLICRVCAFGGNCRACNPERWTQDELDTYTGLMCNVIPHMTDRCDFYVERNIYTPMAHKPNADIRLDKSRYRKPTLHMVPITLRTVEEKRIGTCGELFENYPTYGNPRYRHIILGLRQLQLRSDLLHRPRVNLSDLFHRLKGIPSDQLR